MIEISDEKVMLFSDFHWGKSKDSQLKLKANDKFIDWFIEKCIDRKIKTIVFMGDWFDARNSISVKTYNHSFDALQKISNAGLTMYLFVGNHDAYFKDTIEVNSLRPLANIKNIHIVENAEEVHFSHSNLMGGFMPWDCFSYSELQYKKWDLMFGHFEFTGAKFHAAGSATCKEGYDGNLLTKVSPLVFSGHFHARKEYEYKYGKIVSIGCPLQLDWGDYGNEKGIYELNVSTKEYEFIPNDISPSHIKLYWSKVKDKNNFDYINGQYVKLIVNSEYQFEEVLKKVSEINMFGPLKPCETEFTHNTKFDFFTQELFEDQEYNQEHVTKREYIKMFIEKSDSDLKNTINVDKAIKLLDQYYKANDDKDE